jgi:hypothetical protein
MLRGGGRSDPFIIFAWLPRRERCAARSVSAAAGLRHHAQLAQQLQASFLLVSSPPTVFSPS